MSDETTKPEQHELSETCRCGGAFSVNTAKLTDARRDITTWRKLHASCLSRNGSGFTRS